MSNTLEYILNLGGNLPERLRRIGVSNDRQLSTWAAVQQRVQAAERTMANMGRSVGSLRERLEALRMQREWIPAENVEAIRRSNHEIRELERQIRELENLNGGRLSAWFRSLGEQIPMLNALRNPLLHIAMGAREVFRYFGEGRDMYRRQTEAETKLAAVMRNTVGVERGEVAAILELTSAQQRLGVIGDEVQLAGAQELATYLTKKESLEGLIPVMNDMLAQQYGLNASQEQAQNIASMLGKVMNGQVGALSRYGYKFDEAQEKILRHGTESQRLATLVNVVSESVGGVNAALAATPEGKLKQIANNAGDLQERAGRLAGLVQNALSPVAEKMQELIDRALSFLERHIKTIGKAIGVAAGAFLKLLSVIEVLAPCIAVMGAAWLGYSIKLKAVTIWTKIVEIATVRLTATLKFLKSAWGIFGLVATAATGAYLAISAFNKAQGRFAELTGGAAAKIGVEQRELNELFEALKKTNPKSEERKRLLAEMNEKYPDLLSNLKLEKAGEEEIEAARKKANDELARTVALQSLRETSDAARQKIFAAEKKMWESLSGKYSDEQIGASMDKVGAVVAEKIKSGNFASGAFSGASNILIGKVMREAFGSAGHSIGGEEFHAPGSSGAWKELIDVMLENQQSVHVLERFLAGRYGIPDADLAAAAGVNSTLIASVNGNKKSTTANESSIAGSNEAIATGGRRSTTVNISINDMVREINFNGSLSENRDDLQREIVQVMMRALGMAETAAG